MSLVAAYSDSESENESEEESNESQSKGCGESNESKNDDSPKRSQSNESKNNNSPKRSQLNESKNDSPKRSQSNESKNDSPKRSQSNESKNDSPKRSQSNICSDTTKINNDSNHNHSSTPFEEESSQHFQIEDDDAWMGSNLKHRESTDSQSTLFSALPQPKSKEREIVEEVDDEFIKKVNKYETIDKPVDKPASTSELPNDIEKLVNRNSLILPKPLKGSGKKGTVKISIPRLEDVGADSDSDEEESKITRKNIPTCKTKSTLFSMLPKPKHSVTVGANKNKMFTQQANRPLVPHTLTKKKETVTNSKSTAKKVKNNSLVGEFSDSDNEDENDISGNFFSLGESRANDKDTLPAISSASPTITNTSDIKTHSSNVSRSSSSISNTSTLSNASSASTKNTAILQKSKSDVKSNEHTASTKENVSTDTRKNNKDNSFFSNLMKSNTNANTNTNKSSLKSDSNISTLSKPKVGTKAVTTSHVDTKAKNTSTSKSNIASSHGNVTGPYGDVTGPYGDVTGPYGDVTGPYGGVTGPYGGVTAPYGGVAASGSTMNYESTAKCYPTSQYAYDCNTNQSSEQQRVAMNVDYSSKPNEDSLIDKDALRQLQGSKRKRENINLIDIQGPDVRGDTDKLLRNLTSEGVAQQKKKNDEDAPTNVQKKKHQIQYLAHQAKERELQLQQAWAESRATKQQTQSRYGF